MEAFRCVKKRSQFNKFLELHVDEVGDGRKYSGYVFLNIKERNQNEIIFSESYPTWEEAEKAITDFATNFCKEMALEAPNA